MKRIFTLLIGVVLFLSPVYAQRRVVDATDHSPIPTATIFDASGNVVGFTSYEGSFSEIPESAYPLTLTSIGYEPLVIDSAEDKTWEMKPKDVSIGRSGGKTRQAERIETDFLYS